MKSEFKKSVAGLTLAAAAAMTSTAALAAVDLSPWKNASGENLGTTPDITFAAPPEDLTPVQVGTEICNYGDETVTSTLSNPIEIKFGSTQANLMTDADANDDTKALADGVSLAPGACTTVSFTWTPDITQNVTEVAALVNPRGTIFDSNTNNDLTIRSVAIGTEPAVPELDCSGFYSPFDKDISISNKTKRAIPVKIELFDEYGQAKTDYDIASPPVINVTFNSTASGNGSTDDAVLDSVGSSNDGNQFTFNSAEQLWQYNLGTKQFDSTGTYHVTVTSGDSNEYTINSGNQCSQSFTRQP